MQEVVDRLSFQKRCRKTLFRILDIPYLHVTLERPLPQLERYIFSSAGASKAEAGDRTYSVVPFYDAGYSKYWLAVSIDLAFQKKCYLKNVRLIVFEGEFSDNIKTPILRAEWDSRQESPPLMIHAQPHWHVYSSAVGTVSHVERIEPKFRTDIKSFSPLPQMHRREEFHFAMASQWHIGQRDSHAWDLEVEALLRWLVGCISYIHDQLRYVSTLRRAAV